MPETDRAVLDTLADAGLSLAAIDLAFDIIAAKLTEVPGDLENQKAETEATIKRLDAELANLGNALAAGGGNVVTILDGIKSRER